MNALPPAETTERNTEPKAAHEIYEKLGSDIGKLVSRKQKAYGDSFGRSGDILRILYPEGITPDKYDDALAVIRILDKLFRIATDRDALGESPYRDIAGYGILGAERTERQEQEYVYEETPNNP